MTHTILLVAAKAKGHADLQDFRVVSTHSLKLHQSQLEVPLVRFLLDHSTAFSSADSHPLAALNTSNSELQASLSTALKELAAVDAHQQHWTANTAVLGASRNADAHLRAFRDFVYRLAEHFELLEKALFPQLTPFTAKHDQQAFSGRLKKARRSAALICNKIKHNANRLQCVDLFYTSGEYVAAFSLCRLSAGCLEPNPEFHEKDRTAISFNMMYRDLFCDLLDAERAAHQLGASAKGMVKDDAPSGFSPWPIFPSAKELAKRPDVGAGPRERSAKIRSVQISGSDLSWGLLPRKSPLPSYQAEIVQTIPLDGVTRSFKFAG